MRDHVTGEAWDPTLNSFIDFSLFRSDDGGYLWTLTTPELGEEAVRNGTSQSSGDNGIASQDNWITYTTAELLEETATSGLSQDHLSS